MVRSGKMPTTSVRRRISLLNRSWGTRSAWGKCGECQQIRAGHFQVFGGLGELVGERVDSPIMLASNGFSIGLAEHRMQQGLDPWPRCLRSDAHQVRRVVRAATLPGSSWQHGAHRGDHSGVRVAGDQLSPAKPRAVSDRRNVSQSGKYAAVPQLGDRQVHCACAGIELRCR